MNKLLKGFLDSKTILTEFLAGFERALERREEAEDIAAVREILYPTHAITHNPIEQQATQCLTRYAYKKFAAEWREKDAYAIEETINESAATRKFKLWRFEQPSVIRRVSYDGRLLKCCCRNLEFAGIVCRHSLAIAARLSLNSLDSAHFPQRWRKDPSELELARGYIEFYSRPEVPVKNILTPQEPSGEVASRTRYLRMNRQCMEITRRISTDADLSNEFATILENFLKRIYSPPDTSVNALMPTGVPVVRNPIKSKTSGRPKKGRIRAEKENYPFESRPQKRTRKTKGDSAENHG